MARETRAGRRRKTKSQERRITRLIAAVDTSGLRSDFEKWPDLSEATWRGTSPPQAPRLVHSVIFSGMGGSGISGDLLCDIAAEQRSSIRMQTVKDYHLPGWAGPESLLVAISCSGNTEETISCVSEAAALGIERFGFGSGGLLREIAARPAGFAFTRTDSLKVPRTSFPALFFSVLKFLSNNGLLSVSEEDIRDCMEALRKIRVNCDAARNSHRNPALDLATELVQAEAVGSPVVIYSSSRTRAVGLRFRQSLNENSKLHAFNGEVPELCHNDIVGWDAQLASVKAARRRNGSLTKRSKRPGFAVLLELPNDPPETKARFEVVERVVSERGGKIVKATCAGDRYLGRVASMLYFLDYSTYFTAILRGVDPGATPSIDQLKRAMARKLDPLRRFRDQNS